MSVFSVAGVGLLSAMVVLMLREWRAAPAGAVRVCAVLVLFGAAFSLYAPLISRMKDWLGEADTGFLSPLLRALGIGVVCELTASLCRDLGEGSVGEGVLLFGRLEILLLSLPLVEELLGLAKEMLTW